MSTSGLVEKRLQKQRAQRAKYAALVRRLSLQRQANPGRYRAKVVAFACLGYAYVFAVLLFGLGILGVSIW